MGFDGGPTKKARPPRAKKGEPAVAQPTAPLTFDAKARRRWREERRAQQGYGQRRD